MRDTLDETASDNGAEEFCLLCEALAGKWAGFVVPLALGVLAMLVVSSIT